MENSPVTETLRPSSKTWALHLATLIPIINRNSKIYKDSTASAHS